MTVARVRGLTAIGRATARAATTAVAIGASRRRRGLRLRLRLHQRGGNPTTRPRLLLDAAAWAAVTTVTSGTATAGAPGA